MSGIIITDQEIYIYIDKNISKKERGDSYLW